MDAALGCTQKLVTTISLPSTGSLATERLHYTVPCVGRCDRTAWVRLADRQQDADLRMAATLYRAREPGSPPPDLLDSASQAPLQQALQLVMLAAPFRLMYFSAIA